MLSVCEPPEAIRRPDTVDPTLAEELRPPNQSRSPGSIDLHETVEKRDVVPTREYTWVSIGQIVRGDVHPSLGRIVLGDVHPSLGRIVRGGVFLCSY